MELVDKDQLAELLRVAEGPTKKLLVVTVPHGEVRIDWESLGECTNCGLPAIDYGQNTDCRYGTNGSDGLHRHIFHDHSEFHLDSVDGCRWPLKHAETDTNAYGRAAAGAALGGALGGLGGSGVRGKNGKRQTGSGAILGALAGAVIGAATAKPKRKRKVVSLDELIELALRRSA